MAIGAIGTVRVNRTDKCLLSPPEQLKKIPRGTFYYHHDQTTSTLVVRWNDNSVFMVASNCCGSQAQRYSYTEKKAIPIRQLYLIAECNMNTGGVDRMDENVALYRISIRT